jgi:hypothetical protein
MPHSLRVTVDDRIARFRSFFDRNEPGDLLVTCNYRPKGFQLSSPEAGPDLDSFLSNPRAYARDRVRECRELFELRMPLEDHSIPFIALGIGAGALTGLFSGAEVRILSETTWCAPVLNNWDDVPHLNLHPHGPWLEALIEGCQAVLEMMEDDLCLMPCTFRSPLDLANGVRGDQLFEDLYERPDEAKLLIQQCAQATIQLRNLLSSVLAVPSGRWGMWRSWLPDESIFLNADPIDMIHTPHAREFDQPFTQQVLDEAPGGGFLHHHTMGVHQISYVSAFNNLVVQNLVSDPTGVDPMVRIRTEGTLRNQIIEASRRFPIHWKFTNTDALFQAVDILRNGRFIFDYYQTTDFRLCKGVIDRVKSVSNFS